MRFAFPIALTFCTQFASTTTNDQLPPWATLTLLHDTGSGCDQIAVLDSTNSMSLLLDLPFEGATAIASRGVAGPVLVALPTAGGATIYEFTIVGGQLQNQVVHATVNSSVHRLVVLSETVLAIVMANEIVIDDPAAESALTLLPTAGMEFVDLAPTTSGFAVLSKSASQTTITRYAPDLSLLDDHPFPTITSPTSLCEMNSATLCVGTATSNGAMFNVSYVGSGGGTTATATPIAPATSEVVRTVSKPDVWVVGTFHHIRIIPKNVGPQSAPIELNGTLQDVNVVRVWS
jgi:hypothetical protein